MGGLCGELLGKGFALGMVNTFGEGVLLAVLDVPTEHAEQRILIEIFGLRHPLLRSNKFVAQKFFENDVGNPCISQKLLSETAGYGTLSFGESNLLNKSSLKMTWAIIEGFQKLMS